MKATAKKTEAEPPAPPKPAAPVRLPDVSALPDKQQAAIVALLSHPTTKEAALAAGVSEPTLWRYMQDEKFASCYREARRLMVNRALERLQRDADDAAKTLRAIADDAGAPASARVAAARIILENSIRWVEIEDVETRLARVETFLQAEERERAEGKHSDADDAGEDE